MKYIHIKNLEKYNPGYKDRELIWCKIYFSMINSSYDFEKINDIDKWRLIALIMLEIQAKKPIPYDEPWLQRKISTDKRPISKTMHVLHNFIEFVTEDGKVCNVEKNRIEKNRIEYIQPKKKKIQKTFDFEPIWKKYPKTPPEGKADALGYFNDSVKTDQNFTDIHKALDGYIASIKANGTKNKFIKSGPTWFKDWQPWIDYKAPNQPTRDPGAESDRLQKQWEEDAKNPEGIARVKKLVGTI